MPLSQPAATPENRVAEFCILYFHVEVIRCYRIVLGKDQVAFLQLASFFLCGFPMSLFISLVRHPIPLVCVRVNPSKSWRSYDWTRFLNCVFRFSILAPKFSKVKLIIWR